MKLISIIIPVYKVEKYLNKCVESVVNQTHKNLEIILVDDGSPDNCPAMCNEWAKKDDRIKVIHKKNGGLSDARNAGLEIMTGNYVMFVDSDDFLDASICEKLLNIIEKYDVGFAMCGTNIVDENGNIKAVPKSDENVCVFTDFDALRQLLNPKLPYIMTAWAKLYKSSVFKNIKYPVGKLHEDEFVIANIIEESKSFAYSNEKMYNYLRRSQSIMGQKTDKNVEHSLEAFKQRFAFLSKVHPNNQEIISSHLDQLRWLYFDTKNKKIKQDIFDEFKNTYKLLNKKPLKLFLFRRLKFVYRIMISFKRTRRKF